MLQTPTYKLQDEVIVHDKHFRIKITSEEIQQRVRELAERISDDYRDKNPLFIGVLTGAAIFTVDLIMNIPYNCELSFLRVNSYLGTDSTGMVNSVIGLKEDITNRHVLIVEDIIDTGITAGHLIDDLRQKNPASLKIATALFKPKALKRNLTPDYVGFEVEPEFVIGYGLDYNGHGRNLKDIYVLKQE